MLKILVIEHLVQKLFSRYTDRHTDTGPITLPGPLKSSVSHGNEDNNSNGECKLAGGY